MLSHLHPLNLNDLTVYVHVVHYGSFSAAARVLNLPKANVSRIIKRLEQQLHLQLLQRTTRQLRMTEAGRVLFEQCMQGLLTLESGLKQLQHLSAEPVGALKMTMPTEFGLFASGAWIAEFMQLYPQIHLEVELSTRVVNMLEEGFDIAFRMTPDKLHDSHYIGKKIADFTLKCYASPAFIAQHGLPIAPTQLVHYEFCLFSFISYQHLQFQHIHKPQHIIPLSVNGRFKANHFSMVCDAVVAHLGLGLLPPQLCQTLVQAGKLIEVLPDWHVYTGSMYAMYSQKHLLNKAALLFIEFIVEKFKQHPLLHLHP